VRELQKEVASARLIPFTALTARFPRAVRELARNRNKEVSLEVLGGEMELDRGSLEGLADPLIHLLRNAIDHGIEPPHVRQLAGKPSQGTLRLTAERGKDQFTVVLEDDGRGMDPVRLIETAIERGMVTPEEGWCMSAEQAFMLTCQPGFSTAAEVTDVSGRGVGMDAARAGIQALGGHFSIDSAVGKGTRMIIRLPLTVAIVNVLLVEAGGVTVAIPVNSVLRTAEAWRSGIDVTERLPSIPFEAGTIPLVELHRLVGAPAGNAPIVPLVVTDLDGRRVGFAVDRFVGQQEVYVRPLGRPLGKLAGLSGSTVLGDGRLVFLIDLPAIARLAGC
jgi:two-component system chemotaxis sensor kinase CheA